MICGSSTRSDSGGGIARIGEAGKALLVALGVEAFESAAVHDGFAAHFEVGELGFDAQGQGADGAGVFGDFLADQPSPRVTACWKLAPR